MPIYDYKCETCLIEVEVIRSINAPAEEHAPLADEIPKSDTECAHRWKRVIRGKIAVTKGWNWGHGKGYWAVLLALGHSVTGYW